MPKEQGKRDIPDDVERYVEEHLEQGNDESYAWALAWSRYCEYKNPGSDHCKQNTYFDGKKKSAGKLYFGVQDMKVGQIYKAKWSGDWWYFQPLQSISNSGKIKGLLFIDDGFTKKPKKVYIGKKTNYDGVEWETVEEKLPKEVAQHLKVGSVKPSPKRIVFAHLSLKLKSQLWG